MVLWKQGFIFYFVVISSNSSVYSNNARFYNNMVSYTIKIWILLVSTPDSTNGHTNKKVWATITYYGGYIRCITNMFRNSQVKIAYRTTNTTFEILTHLKQSTNASSGVYKPTCNTCPGVYIGQMGRPTDTRYKEHIRYIRTNNPQSPYALHILGNTHEYGTQEHIMELKKACTKGKLMNCWESLYIQEYHRKGYLITEQQRPQYNLLFDHIRTTLPFKHIETELLICYNIFLFRNPDQLFSLSHYF